MCLVIDSNTIAAVFNAGNAQHPEFTPVRDWLFKGRGKFVYGGKKFRSELGKLTRYRSLLAELQRMGKIVSLDDGPIDARENVISLALKQRGVKGGDKRFNDAHLVAIVAESGVRIVCTLDIQSFRFLRDAAYYAKSTDRPKLYTGSRNHSLLCERHVAPCCR